MKKVEFKGKQYKITTKDYGYTTQQLFVNGEGSSIRMNNSSLDDVSSWKKYAKKAILEYEDRKLAQEEFKKWDGKL